MPGRSRRTISEIGDRVAQFTEDLAEEAGQIQGQEGLFRFPAVADRQFGGASAEKGTVASRVIGGKLLPGQRGANARQHIAHAAAGHAGVAGGVVGERLTLLPDQRARALEQQRHGVAFGEGMHDF